MHGAFFAAISGPFSDILTSQEHCDERRGYNLGNKHRDGIHTRAVPAGHHA